MFSILDANQNISPEFLFLTMMEYRREVILNLYFTATLKPNLKVA